MRLISRGLRALALVLPLLLLAASPAPARTGYSGNAWLYRGSDVPQDKAWVFGELPNGLRYAVRRNFVPPGQVSIRIRMDVGSLYETESERGYAHLLEHLVFRQSKYLADGQAIPTWQRLGATFGSDTNAQTTPTQTVFQLDLPNAKPSSLDESFRLLSGMIAEPTLSEANVRTDVPIVMAEMREYAGAAGRYQDATRETFYAGQRLADHSPIGTVATLEAANEQSVRAFHARWYRPQNAVVVAVGDVEPKLLEALVRKYFSGWKSKGKPTPAPSFGDPVAPADGDPANPVGEARVLVEPDLPRTFTYAIARPWRQVNDTIAYNQGRMVDALAQALINRRLEARARTGGSYLAAQVEEEKVSRTVDGTYVTITPLTPDWQAALRDVRAVIADALATAPSQEEIDREAAEMGVAYESAFEQRVLQPTSRLADEVVNAVDIRETVASPGTVAKIYKDSVPLFTPQNVLEHTRALFAGTVTRAVYLTPAIGEADAEKVRQALLLPVAPDSSARLDTKPISFADMPALGTPGIIKSITPVGYDAIQEVVLSNGIKVLFWPTHDDPGRVGLKVRFGGGYRSFGAGDAAQASVGELALVGSGQGSLGQEELDRITTGRKMGFDFEIDDTAFVFSADTRSADLADQLYLFAAKFASPRWDPAPVLRAKAAAKLQYETYAISPQGVMERDLKFLQHGRDPRYRTATPQEIEALTPDAFRKFWEAALASGPIEIDLYGDFERDATLAVLQRTFGALPPRKPLPAGTAPTSVKSLTASPEPVVLAHRGDSNQASALVAWPTDGGSAGVVESRQLEILTQIFSNRLLDQLREKLGASYAPQVFNSWPMDLKGGGAVMAVAQIQPRDVPAFFALADEITADLVARPVSADELARVTEPLRQQLLRGSSGSGFIMYQLEGATEDHGRVAALKTIMDDLTKTTPEKMQQLAAKYLGKDRSWRLAVLPQGQSFADLPQPAAAATGPAPVAAVGAN